MPDRSDNWVKFPLVSPLDQRYADESVDGLMTNCFIHKDETGQLIAVRRDGFTETTHTLSEVGAVLTSADGVFAARGIGAFGSPDVGAFVVTRNNAGVPHLYFVCTTGTFTPTTIPNFNTLTVNELTASWNRTNNPATENYYLDIYGGLSGGLGYAYYSTDNGATFNQITDVNFPSTRVYGSAYLNGLLYVCDDSGRLWNSKNQEDFSTWDAIGVINAYNTPGQPVQVHKHLNEVIVFKTRSAEVFYDAGNPIGSPLLPLQQVSISVGCVVRTVQEINDVTYWASIGPNGEYRVQMMQQFQPQEISSPAVNRLLQTCTSFRSWQMRMYGYTFYCIGMKKDDGTAISLAYNISTQQWSRLTWLVSDGGYSSGNAVYFVGSSDNTDAGTLSNSSGAPFYLLNNGKLFNQISEQGYDQISGPTQYDVEQRVRLPNFTNGTTLGKYLSQVRLMCSQRSSGQVFVRYSDDDYQTWSSWRAFNTSDKVPILNFGGSFVRRAWEIKYSGVNNPRIIGLEGLLMDCDI